MIVHNEEKHIHRSISSIKPFVNEIIVVDHNSTDNTSRIAREMGAKVLERNWTHHFAEARNYAIAQAKSPIIMIMDADEEMVSYNDSIQEACRLLSRSPGLAARVEIQNITSEKKISTSWITRMFPNSPEYRYYGRIHEQLHYSGGEPTLVNSGIKLSHVGYMPEQVENKQKNSRNLELLMMELEESPDNAYILFQIGRSYELKQDCNQAMTYYLAAKDRIKFPNPHYYSSLLYHMATTTMKLRNWGAFFEIIGQALNIYPDYTDLYYIYGSGIIESRNPMWFPMIQEAFNACIQLGEANPQKYETVLGVGTYRAHYNLGLYFELTENVEQAICHYTISHNQGFDNAFNRLQVLTNKN